MSNSSGLWFYNLAQSNTAYTRALNSSILLADATKPSQTFSSLRNVGSGGEEYDLFFDSVDVNKPIAVYDAAKNNKPKYEPKVLPKSIFPSGFPSLYIAKT